MIESISIELWIIILFTLYFFLVVFLFFLVKNLNRFKSKSQESFKKEQKDKTQALKQEEKTDKKNVSYEPKEIIDILEPLVKESRNIAITFDEQIKEKKRLIKKFNDALDSRIISINLLLSRADSLQKRLEAKQDKVNETLFVMPKRQEIKTSAVLDQQNQIIKLYNQDFDVDSIAQKLSIPREEVQLVIDLKNKFVAMEKKNK